MYVLYKAIHRLFRDIEAEKQAAEQTAFLDPLTQLPNRKLLMDRIAQAIRQKTRDGIDVAVLVIDLDKFKSINDTFGHSVGDQLIEGAAKRFQERLREVDTLSRIGGDEFAILLPQVADAQGVQKVCEDLLSSVQEVFLLSGKEIYIGASIGAALGADDDTVIELFQKADIAMYKAKERGDNQPILFSPEMGIVANRKRKVENKLREALASGDGLDVHFQPIVSNNQSVIGLEGFFRWTDTELGSVSPGEAIPIAEECGLIDQVGKYVIDQCIDVAKKFPNITISLNLSALQFRDQSLNWRIEDQVTSQGLSGSQFELEITEKLLIDQSPEFLENLNKLKKAGFKFALDDFGTGYSSLNCLNQLKIDTLKLDSKFVSEAKKNNNISLLQSAVALGHTNGLRVIAEGVSDQDHCDIALSSGCDGIQGHLIAEPMPRGELYDFFLASSKNRLYVA